MTYGLYDYERRYRRRYWMGLIKFVLFVVFVLFIALFAYQVGFEQFKDKHRELGENLEAVTEQKGQLEAVVQRLKEVAIDAKARAEELEERLERETPQGERKRLLELITERLISGVNPERLAFVIAHSSDERACSEQSNKRFVLTTPIYEPPTPYVSFENGAVTVTGEGESARNAAGRPEAWFDPQGTVRLRIRVHGAETREVEGILPMTESVVIGDTEHRFTIAPGPRSFVQVTYDRCAFP